MASPYIRIVTDDDFEAEVINSDLPVMVQFSATWCGPCKMMSSVVEKIANEFSGKIRVAKLDIDDSPQMTQKYGIRSVPTVLLFRGGQKHEQYIGLATRDKLVQVMGL